MNCTPNKWQPAGSNTAVIKRHHHDYWVFTFLRVKRYTPAPVLCPAAFLKIECNSNWHKSNNILIRNEALALYNAASQRVSKSHQK
jgi:hypothetical protein